MASKSCTGFAFVLLACALLLPAVPESHAQLPAFSTKGVISESSNFHGVVMWTIVDNSKGTVILQSPAGRGILHLSMSPSTACDMTAKTCLLSTVSDAYNSDAFKAGDTARFSVNLESKQESVLVLSGTLAGFDVSVNLSKAWVRNATSAPSDKEGTAIANPASVYCANHGGKLDIRTTPQGQTGICMFQGGYECEEWSYFRGECVPGHVGENSTAVPANTTSHRHLTVELNETVGINTKS